MADFDLTTSNLIMMVGGQLLWMVILIGIMVFGVEPITSPFRAAQELVQPGSATSSGANSAANGAIKNAVKNTVSK